MGGVTLNNAGVLANTLKSKVSELDIRARIEPTADLLLRHEYGTPTLRELAPGRRNAAKITNAGTNEDPRYKLDVLAGSFKNTGVIIPDTSRGDEAARAPNRFIAQNTSATGANSIFWRGA